MNIILTYLKSTYKFIILFIIISVPAIKENSKITKELNG